MRLGLLLLAPLLFGQQRSAAPPPKPLEPPQPVLTWIYPAGGRQGTTVEVAASGTGIQPETVVVSGGGVTTKVIESKDANNTRFAVTIAGDAATGVRELRILNAGGVSNRFRFVVGDLPEIKEVEPNSDKGQAQKIEAMPVVVNGQILDGDRDYFRIHAKAGETLVLEVQARALLPFIADAVPGWFDPIVAVYDAAGKQLAYADDFRFHPDPILLFQAPRDGDYVVEVRDVIYRGRGDFIYRLKMGNAAAVRPDTAAIHLPATEMPAIEGCIKKPGESVYYPIHVNKGEKWLMEVQARRFGSPLDSILTLMNDKGAVLAENDDWSDPMSGLTTQQVDSRLLYTFAAAGDYKLRLRDVQGNGGDDYVYRLILAPPHPDFALRITPDNPRLGQGDTAAITVTAVRRDEFTGEIQLAVQDLPPGFRASDGLIPPGINEGRLTVTAPAGAPLGIYSPTVVGTAVVGKDTVLHKAQAAETMMQAFAYTHFLPTSQLFLAVIPNSAFTISTDSGALELKPGSETEIHVKVHRHEGVTAAVTVLPLRLGNNAIVTKTGQVPPEKDEVTILVSIDKDAKPGLRQDMILNATMRTNGQTITRYAPAIPVRIVAK